MKLITNANEQIVKDIKPLPSNPKAEIALLCWDNGSLIQLDNQNGEGLDVLSFKGETIEFSYTEK
jgi:hypothetical protein